MNSSSPASSALAPANSNNTGPTTPRIGTPEIQTEADPSVQEQTTKERNQRVSPCQTTTFGDDIPGMEGLGTDITVICPWEAFSHLELHELAQFGII
ncbi:unnamed protein product [Ranitomeya imitator]|uniref:Retinal cone rhodopsin-sensitive cGMP 3',5'-cyclic phosphodiesterase subunit gamma n=1 Tax=Ranitomeya imitator TaxID=111125 RepID=A0ABN9LL03_9NEOB|nr:unnamed protein product [Ranitomeya imitator]